MKRRETENMKRETEPDESLTEKRREDRIRGVVLEIIRAALWGVKLKTDSTEEIAWADVYREFRDQALVMLPCDLLLKLPLDEETGNRWKSDIIREMCFRMRLLAVQKEALDALERGGIASVVLKGTAAAMLYPNPDWRSLGDIDLLAPLGRFDDARRALREAGFEFSEEKQTYQRHVQARKNGVTLELHRYFSTGENKRAPALDAMIAEGLAARVPQRLDDAAFFSLPPKENGLVLLEHLAHHLRTGLGLRQLLDFVMYAGKYLTDAYWQETFGPAAKRLSLDTLACTVGRMGQLYFGLDPALKWCGEAEDALCGELLELCFSHGNMGRKSDAAMNPTINALNNSGGGLRKRLVYEQKSGLVHWRAAREHAALRPLAWVYGGARHAVKLFGNKKSRLRLRADRKESRRQREIYQRLKL